MACGGAQVRNVRDLVPVRQATAGMADHDGGFSYVHRRATKPAAVGRRSSTAKSPGGSGPAAPTTSRSEGDARVRRVARQLTELVAERTDAERDTAQRLTAHVASAALRTPTERSPSRRPTPATGWPDDSHTPSMRTR